MIVMCPCCDVMSLVLALPHHSGLEIHALIELPLLNHLRKNRKHIHQFIVYSMCQIKKDKKQQTNKQANLCPIYPLFEVRSRYTI